ncbi:MAG TPA: PQQ-binding-like beta-propeller repeat protein [Euzebyales bacterium]
MSPAAGRSFGGYRLLRSIASDAISTTYLAMTDDAAAGDSGGPRFAVRVIGRVSQRDEQADELVQQFLAEAQRAGAVDHPSIVRPRDLGVIDGHPYVVAPFIRAVPLRDMLSHGGTINEAAALAIFAQLAGGLDVAHRADVVHGSLSTRSIWIGPSTGKGVAYVGYLTGFGSSGLLRERFAHEPRGAPVDDLLYVAPEQLRAQSPTRATDQYALACALYHTLTGEPPFRREDRAKLYGAHLMAPVPTLLDIDPAADPATSAALQRGMDKYPSRRFASCGRLINAALPDRGETDPALTVTPAASQSPPDPSAARPRWPLLLVVGLGVLLLGVVWFLARSNGVDASTAPVAALASQPTTETGRPAAAAPPRTAPLGPDTTRWSTQVSNAAVTAVHPMKGSVLVVDEDGTAARVAAGGGRVRWRALVGTGSVTVGGGLVVHGLDDLGAVDAADGDDRWSRGDGPTASLHLFDGTVVGAAETDDGAEVLAVAVADGAEVWHASGPAPQSDARITLATGRDLIYGRQHDVLFAVEPSGALGTEQGRRQVATPRWQVDVPGLWPALTATDTGVAVATRSGEVCHHGGGGGIVDWCADVPGADREQPRLSVTGDAVVAATSRAVVALGLDDGTALWSSAPGSPANLVAVGDAAVAIADGAGGVLVLDAATGDRVLALTDVGVVTAIASRAGWIAVGTADGRVLRFDLETA